MLHAQAVDGGGFPEAALAAFTEPLQYPAALSSADSFLTGKKDHPVARDAADEAERLLRLAWSGDEAAVRSSFENLGHCYAKPESVNDIPSTPTDEAAATNGRH